MHLPWLMCYCALISSWANDTAKYAIPFQELCTKGREAALEVFAATNIKVRRGQSSISCQDALGKCSPRRTSRINTRSGSNGKFTRPTFEDPTLDGYEDLNRVIFEGRREEAATISIYLISTQFFSHLFITSHPFSNPSWLSTIHGHSNHLYFHHEPVLHPNEQLGTSTPLGNGIGLSFKHRKGSISFNLCLYYRLLGIRVGLRSLYVNTWSRLSQTWIIVYWVVLWLTKFNGVHFAYSLKSCCSLLSS